MLKKFGKILAIGPFVFTLAPNLCGQLSSQKVINYNLALTLAQESIAMCRSEGYHVTATVVDSGNSVRAILRDDKALPSTLEISRMKATSVIMFGRASGPPTNLQPGQPVPAPVIPGTIHGLGGVPIIANGILIGAIGVSGAPGGEKDAACANAALEKVADQLK